MSSDQEKREGKHYVAVEDISETLREMAERLGHDYEDLIVERSKINADGELVVEFGEGE